MATHSRILPWRMPWTEELGGLQSMGSQRVRHNWATNTFHFHIIHYLCDMYYICHKFSSQCEDEWKIYILTLIDKDQGDQWYFFQNYSLLLPYVFMFLGIKSYILYVNYHSTISISSFKNSTFNIYLNCDLKKWVSSITTVS